MKNEMQIFDSPEFGNVRMIMIDGDPWFVGKDVAEAIGYADGFGALKKHVDDEDKQNWQNDSFETPRGMTIINESGLFSLILGSKLDSAKRFKRWVTAEVLPSIRKTGRYYITQRNQGYTDFIMKIMESGTYKEWSSEIFKAMEAVAVKFELTSANAPMARVYEIFNESHSFTLTDVKNERIRRHVEKGELGWAEDIAQMSMLRYAYTEDSIKEAIEQIVDELVEIYDIKTDVQYLVLQTTVPKIDVLRDI